MTQSQTAAHEAGPEGSIFLPKTERDLRSYQAALLLGRGPGAGKTPDELAAAYEASERALDCLRQKVRPEIAVVALTSEI